MFSTKIPWVILLVLWILGSAWWHVCRIKQLCPYDLQSTVVPADTTLLAAPVAVNKYIIEDGNRFQLVLPGSFSFAKSGANANMTTLGGSLDPMITYLKANTGRTLELIGYYAPSEANPYNFPQPGSGPGGGG